MSDIAFRSQERIYAEFDIIEGLDNMQMDAVMALLKTTHWASHRFEQQEQLAMEHSFSYGARCCKTGRQIAFARVATDYGTTYYLCDVIVDSSRQHKGVGRALLKAIQENPLFHDLRGILINRDAQPFYAKFGFEKSDRGMVKSAKES